MGEYHNRAIRKQERDRALINTLTMLFTVITFAESNPIRQTCIGNEGTNNEDFKLGLRHCLLTASGTPDSGTSDLVLDGVNCQDVACWTELSTS